MKPAIILLFVLATAQAIKAQSDSGSVRKTYWFNMFQLRLPEIGIDRIFPFRNPDFAALPHGMDQYMYPTKGGFGAFADFAPNYNFRFLALYYKERIGLELYAGGYGARVDPKPFKDFMETKFPNYVGNDLEKLQVNKISFSGWQIGLTYEEKWKGLIIIPKLLLGFEKMHTVENNWRLKENGSNQFTYYQVRYHDSSRHQNSYHAQLRVAKRMHLGHDRTFLEVGLKTEYILSGKKHLNFHIVEEPYGKPANTVDMEVQTRYQSFAAGVYVTFFLKSRHLKQ